MGVLLGMLIGVIAARIIVGSDTNYERAVLPKPLYDAVRVELILRHKDAVQPHRSRESDAGYDVHSLINVDIAPGDIVNIDTGLALVAPSGYFFTVEGRSSMYKSGVIPFRGIIDGGYSGNMVVTLMNVGKETYSITKGDRVAQLVPQKTVPITIETVPVVSKEYDIRGTKGFGSSGR